MFLKLTKVILTEMPSVYKTATELVNVSSIQRIYSKYDNPGAFSDRNQTGIVFMDGSVSSYAETFEDIAGLLSSQIGNP